MRCFLACFTTCKHNKRLNAPPDYHSRHVSTESLPLQSKTVEISSTKPIGKKLEEQLICNGETKVTSFNNRDKNDGVLSMEKAAVDLVGKNEEKSNEKKPISTLISSKEASAALNPNSKEESEDLEFRNDGEMQESSESLFSLSIDSRKYTDGGEVGEKEVSSPMPKSGSSNQQGLNLVGSNHNSTLKTRTLSAVDSALTPVENLHQLKTAKATATSNSSLHSQDKENINFETSSFELLCKKEKANLEKLSGEEIAVDTSLSSWLIKPETTPLSKNSADSDAITSPCSAEGRHILGALTVTQVRGQQKSQNQSKNLGTVGSLDSDSSLGVQEPVTNMLRMRGGTWLDSALCKTVLQN